ncbi:MAG: acyl-CoA thioesterase [Myxococcales bacterium]
MNRWPVTIELPVQWGDMDSFGHVNNVVYLRWFESARITYFERAGILAGMPDVGPIQARQVIDYRLPLTYPDRLLVSTTVTKLGNTSFTMGLRLRSHANDRAIAAEGEAVIVMVDYRNGRKVPLGDALRASIEALESTGPEAPPPEGD